MEGPKRVYIVIILPQPSRNTHSISQAWQEAVRLVVKGFFLEFRTHDGAEAKVSSQTVGTSTQVQPLTWSCPWPLGSVPEGTSNQELRQAGDRWVVTKTAKAS